MKYCIDVDNTICISSSGCDYSKCPPIQPVIDKINTLYDAGHHITLYTARNMKTFQGDINKIHKTTKPILEHWLHVNNVRYTEIIFGKPFSDCYCSKKLLSIEEFTDNQIKDVKINKVISSVCFDSSIQDDILIENKELRIDYFPSDITYDYLVDDKAISLEDLLKMEIL